MQESIGQGAMLHMCELQCVHTERSACHMSCLNPDFDDLFTVSQIFHILKIFVPQIGVINVTILLPPLSIPHNVLEKWFNMLSTDFDEKLSAHR